MLTVATLGRHAHLFLLPPSFSSSAVCHVLPPSADTSTLTMAWPPPLNAYPLTVDRSRAGTQCLPARQTEQQLSKKDRTGASGNSMDWQCADCKNLQPPELLSHLLTRPDYTMSSKP